MKKAILGEFSGVRMFMLATRLSRGVTAHVDYHQNVVTTRLISTSLHIPTFLPIRRIDSFMCFRNETVSTVINYFYSLLNGRVPFMI